MIFITRILKVICAFSKAMRLCNQRLLAISLFIVTLTVSALATGWFVSLPKASLSQPIPVVAMPSSVADTALPDEETIKEIQQHKRVYIDPAEIDLGSVETGTAVQVPIRVVNELNHPVTITKIKVACSCNQVDSPKEPINSGEFIRIELRVEVPHKTNRSFGTKFTFFLDGELDPIVFRVFGRTMDRERLDE